jgi:hypothetical protein
VLTKPVVIVIVVTPQTSIGYRMASCPVSIVIVIVESPQIMVAQSWVKAISTAGAAVAPVVLAHGPSVRDVIIVVIVPIGILSLLDCGIEVVVAGVVSAVVV